MPFLCKRCAADPQPEDFVDPRSCGFDAAGVFTADNWNCVTLNLLVKRTDARMFYGIDETLHVIRCPEDHNCGEPLGWVALSRYKSRGRCSSAVHLGDFYPPVPLTLELAEAILAMNPPYREENDWVDEFAQGET